MNADRVNQALDDIRRKTTRGQAAGPMHVPLDGGGQLEGQIEQVDELACRWRELRLGKPQGAEQPREQLEARARRLERRLDYLEEPIRLIEADRLAGELLLRSAPPRRQGRRRTYYELRASAHQIRVTRQQADGREPAGAVPVTSTRETFARLIDDLHAWWQ